MKQLIVIFCIGCNVLVFAQVPDTLWTRIYGGHNSVGFAAQQTLDGGYIIAGETSNIGSPDMYLVKTDSIGDTLWTKTFGGDSYDRAWSVQQTVDHGYVLVGESDLNMRSTQMFLVKTNADGDTMWTRLYGGFDFDKGYAIDQTSDGGYIVFGLTKSFGQGADDVWLVRLDAYGDTIWIRTFGSEYIDIAFAGRQVSDGGFIAAGYTFSNGTGYSDALLIKTDYDGNMQWEKTYGNQYSERFNSVQQTTDGGYIAVGGSMLGSRASVVYIVRTDPQGDTLWTRTCIEGYNADGSSVDLTNDGGYIIVGTAMLASGRAVYFVKINDDGDIQWTKQVRRTMNSINWGYSVQQTMDGGYIAAGSWNEYMCLIRLTGDTNIIKRDSSTIQLPDHYSTIFSGPLVLPGGRKCKIFDITGGEVKPHLLQPGIYFLEIDGIITQKVIKIR